VGKIVLTQVYTVPVSSSVPYASKEYIYNSFGLEKDHKRSHLTSSSQLLRSRNMQAKFSCKIVSTLYCRLKSNIKQPELFTSRLTNNIPVWSFAKHNQQTGERQVIYQHQSASLHRDQLSATLYTNLLTCNRAACPVVRQMTANKSALNLLSPAFSIIQQFISPSIFGI